MRVNWDHIEEDKTFQRLINHLMGLECPAIGFIPSSPYIGKDGGWDGLYNGLYPVENIEGLYSFQAKWTKHNRQEATKYLRSAIPKEIIKAESKGVQHLRIATNAELDDDQVLELESLDKGKLSSLKVWEREHLSLRIDKRPFLLHKYFNYPQHPLFLPWDLYIKEHESHLLIKSPEGLVTFENALDYSKSFLKQTNAQVLLVHAPAGYGKTHLLKEIARNAPLIDQSVEPMWARLPLRSLKDAIQDEVIGENKYLLIIDDADRSPEGIEALMALLPLNRGNIKVVLGSRSACKHIVEDSIAGAGYEVNMQELCIPDWSSEDRLQLLRFCAKKKQVEDEEELVKLYRVPYLITWIGQNITGEAKPASEMLNILVTDLKKDAIKSAQGILDDEFQLKRILLHLALIVPFSVKSDSHEIIHIAEQVDTSPDRVFSLINKWVDAGILRTIGDSCRFSPDLKGEFYLNQEISQLDDAALKSLIDPWLNHYPERIFGNLGSTYRLGEVSIIQNYLSNLVTDWIHQVNNADAYKRSDNLEKLEKIAFAIPNESIDLIRTYLETSAPVPKDDFGLSKRYGSFSLSTDNYGPVIHQLIKVARVRNRVIKLIVELDSYNIEGTYGNYRPEELIEECVCPLENRINLIVSTLQELEGKSTKLVACALKEVLAGAHEYRRSSGKTLHIGEKYLTKPDETACFRDEALKILKNLIASDDSDDFRTGLEIAERIGDTRMGRLKMRELPLFERFQKEYTEIIELLNSTLLLNPSTRKRTMIEDFLLNHWALNGPAEDFAANILRNFSRSTEYLFLHYYFSPENTVEDFPNLEEEAEKHNDGRWSYFVWNVKAEKRKEVFTNYSGLIPRLKQQCTNTDEIVTFLFNAEEQLKDTDTTWCPTIVRYWVNEDADQFLIIRKNPTLWNKVPERFQIEIDLALSGLDEESLSLFLKEIHEGIDEASIKKCSLFLDIVTDTLPKERAEEELQFFISKRGIEFGSSILIQASRLYKLTSDAELALRLVEAVIHRQETITESIIDYTAHVLTTLHENEELNEERKNKIRPLLLPVIVQMDEISYEGNEILKILIIELSSFIEFLDSRLEEAQVRFENQDYGFDLSPYKGITSITSFIHTYDHYKIFLLQYCDWYSKYSNYFRHELYQLIKPLKLLRDNKGRLYLDKLIAELTTEDELSKAFILAEHLTFKSEIFATLISLCENGLIKNNSNDVKSLLFHFTIPLDGWESEIGEAPPKLVEILEEFKKLKTMSNNKELTNIVDQCIESLEKQIDNKLKSDKEEYN